MEGSSLNRFKEIIKVFAKYGYGYILDIKSKDAKKSPANLRKAFEELGPTFIKIGQILSTRTELIDENYIIELTKLQDNVPPESFESINEVFYNQFNKNIEDVFLFIDKKPLASASIAQVYKGILKDGREVVIKIQRPNIKEKMYMDLEILLQISEKLKILFKDPVINPKDIIIEIKNSTENELNFNLEAKNIKLFRELNKNVTCIYAPYVVDEFTTEKVITLENIEGFKINDKISIEILGYSGEDIAKKLALSYFKQVFKDGFFHGDPHPGNILIRDGKICFIDFGMVGVLTDEFRSRLNDAIDASATEDIDKLTDFVLSIGIKCGKIDREMLYKDVEYLFNNYYTASLKNIKMSVLMQEIMEIAKRNNLRLPSDFVILARSMIIVEGIIVELSPNINLTSLVMPYAKEVHAKYLFSKIDFDEVVFNAYGLTKDIIKLPHKFSNMIDTINRGRTKLNLKVENINIYMNELNKMVNRLSFALIVCGMVVASSIVLNSNPEPKIYGVSIIGLGGYLMSAVFGLWLLISVIRSGSLK